MKNWTPILLELVRAPNRAVRRYLLALTQEAGGKRPRYLRLGSAIAVYLCCAALGGTFVYGCKALIQPSLNVSVDMPTIVSGGMATVTWTSSGTNGCKTGDAWPGSDYANDASLGLAGMKTVSPTATSTYTVNCTVPGSSSPLSRSAMVTVTSTTTPTAYVVDSTNTLYAFSAAGTLLYSVAVPGPVSNINGGGITVAQGNVYVTMGQPRNSVVAYSALTLQPVTLPTGSFSGLSVPRGIVFDTHNNQFYVGNGAAGVNVYDVNGTSLTVPGGFPGTYGPSGLAFDSVHNTIWAANYAYANAPYGVTEWNEDGSAAQTFNYASQFTTPTYPAYNDPYWIAYCATAGNPPAPANLVVVAFSSIGGNSGNGVVQTYGQTGAAVGSPFGTAIGGPRALSCSSQGRVYVAADNGLFVYDTSGNPISLPAGAFGGMTAPIYGVYVTN